MLAALLTLLVDRAWSLFQALASRSRLVARLYAYVDERRRRARRLVQRWGLLGLVAFVALPLPATGMYTGAALALLLGVEGLRLFAALAAGGLASVAIVYAGLKAVSAVAP